MSRCSHLAFQTFKHGSAVIAHANHRASCKSFQHIKPMLSGDRRVTAFQSCHQYRASAWLFSHRPQDSAVSDWNVGEPPIDEKHTERGVTGVKGSEGTTEAGNSSGDAGHTAAPHLGKETDTRQMLRTMARETEERLSHEGWSDGNVEEQEEGLAGRMIGEEEGKSVWALGMRVTVKCPGEMTGGSYCLMEYKLAAGDGCETHTHQREDETWYMLEGEMQWKVGDKSYEAKKGCSIHLPKGVPHSFHNNSTRPAHMLVSCLPAGFENYFLEIGKAVDPDPQAKKPEVTQEEARTATHTARKYGITFTPTQNTHI